MTTTEPPKPRTTGGPRRYLVGRGPLRVTIIFSHSSLSGPNTRLLDLLQGSQIVNLDAVVLAKGGSLPALLRQRGLRVTVIPSGRFHGDLIMAGASLGRLLARERPDVALCDGLRAAAVGVPAGLAAGVRSVWHMHAPVHDTRLTRLLARIADAVVDSSPHTSSSDWQGPRLVEALFVAACRPGAAAAGGPAMSVVTTVYNEVDSISGLCQQLLCQLSEGDEIVVVDAGSHDGTYELLQRLAHAHAALRVLQRPGASISEGRNAGVFAARNDFLAFTDAGCTVLPGWLEALRLPFATPCRPDLVTGVYRAAGRTTWERAFVASSYPLPEEARHPGPLVRPYGRLFGRAFDAVLCTGRSMAVTRQAWAAVSGFPEELRTAEDVMFGRRLSQAGFRCVLTADAEVIWAQRSSVTSTVRMYFSYGRGGGHSGDALLVGRDLARAAAYGFAAWTAVSRRPAALIAAGLGAVAYLSLPVSRAWQSPAPGRVLALIPVTLAVKDISKAAGCLVGTVERQRRLRGPRQARTGSA